MTRPNMPDLTHAQILAIATAVAAVASALGLDVSAATAQTIIAGGAALAGIIASADAHLRGKRAAAWAEAAKAAAAAPLPAEPPDAPTPPVAAAANPLPRVHKR